MCGEALQSNSRDFLARAPQKNLRFDGLRHDRTPQPCINAGTQRERNLI
jgi:hypothetical protein